MRIPATVYDNDPQLFCDLMLERALADHQRLAGAREPAFFDRGISDMVGDAELFGLDTSTAWAASQRYRYEKVVFVPPGWAEIYVTDSERRRTFEAAQAFGNRVREVYGDLDYTIVRVPRDSGRPAGDSSPSMHDAHVERLEARAPGQLAPGGDAAGSVRTERKRTAVSSASGTTMNAGADRMTGGFLIGRTLT